VPGNSKVCVIVPCHNEEGNLKAVIDDLSSMLPGVKILVIDDASDDGTLALALSDKRAEVLALPVNIGVGGSLQLGFKYALSHGFEYAVKFDGDGQHRAGEIPNLLKALEEAGANVAVGSRFLQQTQGYKSTPLRRLGILLLNTVNSLLTGQHITDCTSGFRAYNLEAMKLLAEHYSSLDYPEPGEAVLLHKNGFSLVETPTRMDARLSGSSSISPLKSVYFMLKMLFCIFMVALRVPEGRTS
jgi:glycosyltransferase involved in cell wall biosynthesis